MTIEDREPLIPLLSRKTYVLRKQKDVADLPPEEKILMDKLFGFQPEVTLGSTYNSAVELAVAAFQDQLQRQCEGAYFVPQYLLVRPWMRRERHWRSHSDLWSPRLADPGLGLGRILVAGLLVINGLFLWLLRAPTLSGRVIMDKIEGFRMFLSISEKDRLNLLNPPELHAAALRKLFLPYALALGVEQRWGQQFAQVFRAYRRSERPAVYADLVRRRILGRDAILIPRFYVCLELEHVDVQRDFVGGDAASSSSGSSGFGGGGFSGGKAAAVAEAAAGKWNKKIRMLLGIKTT